MTHYFIAHSKFYLDLVCSYLFLKDIESEDTEYGQKLSLTESSSVQSEDESEDTEYGQKLSSTENSSIQSEDEGPTTTPEYEKSPYQTTSVTIQTILTGEVIASSFDLYYTNNLSTTTGKTSQETQTLISGEVITSSTNIFTDDLVSIF